MILKAVTLTRQHDRVSRNAWLRSWKRLWAFLLFFCCQVCGTRQTHVLTGLYIVKIKGGIYSVSGEIQEGWSMWPITSLRILSEPYILREEESLTNRSSPPKLSALQHWCLRFLLLLKKNQHGYDDYCEQRYDIVLIKDDFLNTEQILEEHKSKIGIHVWITNLQTKPVPDPNTWYIYLSVDVKPCPRVSTWAVTVLSLSPHPPSTVSPASLFLGDPSEFSILCG